MADFDIEEMLEAPYKMDVPAATKFISSAKQPEKSPCHSKTHKEPSSDSRQRHRRSRSRSKERRDRDRRKSRSRSKETRDKERDRDRRRRHSRSRSRSRDKERHRKRADSREQHESREKKRRSPSPILSPEERDARTVFVWQLSARIRPRDLEEFFSAVGEVRDVRLIMDNKTRRSKGIAYVEFRDVASLPLALALSGTKVLGVPIQIQASQAEKNRAGQPSTILASLAGAALPGASVGSPDSTTPSRSSAGGRSSGPVKLYVGCLHPHITEDMLRNIFQPFGDVEDVQLTRNLLTGQSVGNGFVIFHRAEGAQKALELLNGFELAGKTMKLSTVAEAVREEPVLPDAATASLLMGALNNPLLSTVSAGLSPSSSLLDSANLALLANLGAPTGISSAATTNNSALDQPAVQTACFMLTNMFTHEQMSQEADLANELRADVVGECLDKGGLVHVFVDADSTEGNIYCKARSCEVATACVKALHGRYFSGRLVTAAYIPTDSYHELFPDSLNATESLTE